MPHFLACLLAALALAPAAAAAPPVFAPAAPVGTDGHHARVAVGEAGDAVVAWAGSRARPGVFVAVRPAGEASFGAARQVAPDDVQGEADLVLARNAAGVVALGWPGPDGPRVAVGRTDGGFGPVEVVRPAGGPRALPRVRGLAVAPDGTVAVGLADESGAAAVALRAPGGGYGPLQALGADVRTGPLLSADATGGVSAMWTGRAAGNRQDAGVVHVAERRGPGGFGPARTLSPLDQSADIGFPGPGFHGNLRGDALAHWDVRPPGERVGRTVQAAVRPAGGDWGAATSLGPGSEPAGAVNAAGDAVVTWSSGFAFAAASGSFGSPAGSAGAGTVVALDALGTALSVHASGGDASRVIARLLRRDGTAEPEVEVSSADAYGRDPAVATDPFGNGVVAFTAVRQGGVTIDAASYSAGPPQVADLRVRDDAVRFRLDEPARVRISVRALRRGARTATMTAPAAAARNRIELAPRLRRLARRPGRYRLTVRARDAGPRASPTRRVEFRRP